MKKLQNNFTTPEQSKRLLKLGVPADSADCYMKLNGIDIMLWDQPNRHTMSISEFISRAKERAGSEVYIPCWSVGRLIGICLKCSILEQRQVRFLCDGDDDEYSLIDYVITVLESGVMTNHMDFSKLED